MTCRAADAAGPVLDTVAWFAARHHRPFSQAAVTSRLPGGLGADALTMARALQTVGLKTCIVQRRLDRLDPMVLPALAFMKDGAPRICTALDRARGTASVIDPAHGIETEGRLKDIAKRLGRDIVLVAPRADPADARLDPGTRAEAARPGHWFWAPARANWPAWLQVVLAALCINILNLALPLFVLNVYDRVIPNLAFVTLWTLGIGVAIAIAFDMALRLIRASVLERIGRRVDLTAAASLFRQAMAVGILDRPGGAAGLSARIRDFDAVRDFFASATFVAIIDLAFIGIFIAVMFAIVGPLAWVPLLAVPTVLLLALATQLPIGRSVRRAQAMSAKRQAVLTETLLGLDTVKALNAQPVMQREWENAVAAAARVNGTSRFWANATTSGTQTMQQAVSVAIICWGVYLVAEGRITVGALIAANLLAGRVLAPLGMAAQTIFRAQYALKAMAALNAFMAMPTGGPVASARRIEAARVELRGVTYTYPGAERPALSDISLTIDPGECLALLGRVGSGKTTLGKLLAGLLPHDAGQILIDGHGIGQYDPAELRRGIGYLPQDPELFTGTLGENLTMGAPGATPEDIDRALHLAGMDGFVAEAPQGLDLNIGEKGQRLSGGQRQGIALARLLLCRPKLLFLDEPTNAMDQQMEARVITRLRALSGEGVGLILCTHRQSLAALADRFAVLEAGRVALDGPQSEVVAQLRDAARRAAE